MKCQSILCSAMLLLFAAPAAGKSELATPEELKAKVGSDVEVLTRGSLHEAFATPTTHNPVEWPIVKKQPPEMIDELIPEHKPAGNNVIWVPGYWSFEEERNDFVWISGLWRNVPPGRQWVPGYWKEVEGGHRWNPGMWAAAGSKVAYRPRPPKSLERGASTPRPSSNHFYVPGSWVYRDGDYKWRPGYWAPQQRGWVWVPDRYVRAGDRYVYADGYWDRRLSARGQLFAPVYFRNQAHTRADFRFRPTAALRTGSQLLIHLFVRPEVGQFAFGDYYADRYRDGYRPWFEHFRSDGGYDPLLSYYDWDNSGKLLGNLRAWNKYFVGHPEFRPRHTLADQLAFAGTNPTFKHLEQAVLGNTLDRVVANAASTSRFVPVTDQLSRDVLGVTNQIRQLTGRRLKLEAGAAVNQALSLPRLPAVRVPRAAGSVVPANPLNLRNATPQLPLRGGGGGGLPVDVPGLPF